MALAVSASSIQDRLEKARSLFQGKEFPASEALCRDLLSNGFLTPQQKSACQCILGSAQYRMKKPAIALRTLRVVQRENPFNPQINKLIQDIEQQRAHLLYKREADIPEDLPAEETRKALPGVVRRVEASEKQFAERYCSSYFEDLRGYEEALENWRLPKGLVLGRNDAFGEGLFLSCNAKPIGPNELLGWYAGIMGLEDNTKSSSRHLFQVCETGKRGLSFNIDAGDEGNFTRFINHSSASPNAAYHIVKRNDTVQIAVYTTKPILPGEQVLCDYESLYWEQIGVVPVLLTPQTYKIDLADRVHKVG